MAEVSNDPMYKLLKRMQGDMAGMREGIREVKSELGAVRGTLLSIHQDMNNIHAVLGRHELRLDTIEKRPEIRGLAEAQSKFEPHP